MSEPTAPQSGALPSATVIVLRDHHDGLEVLLLQRNPALRTMGGAWVFPGGKVDPEDAGDTPEARARRAAVRELEEEAGLQVAMETLEEFSHWLTPTGVKRRFATWFYATTVSQDVEVTVDNSEIVDHRWLRPDHAIEAERRGDLAIPPPTLVTLNDLVVHGRSSAVLAMAAERQPPYFFPQIVQREPEIFYLYPGDAGYEALDPDIEGPRHRTEQRDGQFIYLRDIEWLRRQQ